MPGHEVSKGRLELTWMGKDMALIPTAHGKYVYEWVDPADPRVCEVKSIEIVKTIGETGADENLLMSSVSTGVSRLGSRVVSLLHPTVQLGYRAGRRRWQQGTVVRQWLPPSVAACNCAMTASRLNDAGAWRGGYFKKFSICDATTACIS